MTEHKESPGQAPEDDQPRLCAFSGCRAALPASTGPGNRARYCQDGKTWGAKNVTCKQAGHAEEILASLEPASRSPSPAIDELAGHIACAVAPTRDLLASLERVEHQLSADVTEALRERDEAKQHATEERGRREAADQRGVEADEHARECERRTRDAEKTRTEAERERDRALRDSREAEKTQLRAQERQATAEEQSERAERRAQEAAKRAEQLDQQLSAINAEVAALREYLAEQRQRADSERDRADRATRDFEDKVAAMRVESSNELEQTRATEAASREQLEQHHAQVRQADAVRHAEETAQLHQELGALRHQLTEANTRLQSRDQELTHLREGLRSVIDTDTAVNQEQLELLLDGS